MGRQLWARARRARSEREVRDYGGSVSMNRYAMFLDQFQRGARRREANLHEIVIQLRRLGRSLGIETRVERRIKSASSTWRKMRELGLEFREIHDILGARVLVDEIDECYQMLGAVRQTWTGLDDRFKDYIAEPKGNGYRSLHLTIDGIEIPHFELQIRTHEMHLHSLTGSAAHSRYKNVSRSPVPTEAA